MPSTAVRTEFLPQVWFILNRLERMSKAASRCFSPYSSGGGLSRRAAESGLPRAASCHGCAGWHAPFLLYGCRLKPGRFRQSCPGWLRSRGPGTFICMKSLQMPRAGGGTTSGPAGFGKEKTQAITAMPRARCLLVPRNVARHHARTRPRGRGAARQLPAIVLQDPNGAATPGVCGSMVGR
jgi:hypothetical protein